MRSIIYGLVCFVLFCSNAFAGCGADQVACMTSCATELMLTRPRDGGMGCNNRCLTAANACEAREAQQQQMEQQRQQAQQQQQQQAAERQAQQARDAKEMAGKQQTVQQAAEIAQQASAEAAIQQQFDTALEKGMQALDQKGYITAEYQFKAALKIKPNNIDAKAGLLHATLGAGKRAAALTYANEQLLALAARPPGADGRSAYAHWLEVLGDNGLAGDAEREQLERIYPFGGGDPESAAAAFPKANPKSVFLPFVRQISGAIPAIRADYADRRREVADAASKVKEEAAAAEASAKEKAVVAEAKAREKAAAAAEVRGKVIKDCATCPDMAVIPAGEFEMGETGSTHRVTLKSFALGKTEVTQGQWKAVMGNNPSNFTNCGDTCPVEQVSWGDAQAFIKKLNAQTGKQYRLPTEAEWEYACRAGERQEYCGSDNLDSVAWYGAYATPVGNSAKTTNQVATKQANAWGLYDMSGNVWEWVEDSWHDNYNGAPADGGAWQGGAGRVLRGGSWYGIPQFARAANRGGSDPADRLDYSRGFRLARTLP